MTSRTGITKDPDKRKLVWKKIVEADGLKMRAWKIMGEPHTSKKSARAAEEVLRAKHKAKGHSGGGKAGKGRWYVYKFNY